MKRISGSIFILTLLVTIFSISLKAQKTPYETSEFKETATYDQAIQYYKTLAAESDLVEVETYGSTDVGKPLHLVIVSGSGAFNPNIAKRTGKTVVMINNAIHPGEPCGVDASMMLVRDLVTTQAYGPLLEDIVLIIIPIYNVGGALNRNCCTRTNQVGPESYGFRGNRQNRDLNRDFIKCDTRNAKTFTTIFREWDPDVFLDTHTTNGADYQYPLTIIPTQKDKLHPELALYMNERMMPELLSKMEEAKYPMGPYCYTMSETPDSGIKAFLETGRYSSGYAALYNCVSFISEAHMLKPYEMRVEATYMLEMNLLKTVNRDKVLIGRARKKAVSDVKSQSSFPIRWVLDTEDTEEIKFRGFEAGHKASEITGAERLFYDRNKPYEKPIVCYNTYKPEVTIEAPAAYIIPQAYEPVIERMKLNGVEMKALSEDVVIDVEAYYIDDYKTMNFAYEGHYPHYNTKVRKEPMKMQFYAGDVVVYVDQTSNRYIVETLEPEAHDSWFNWNFFDGILMQKEWFSSYVFEDEAADLLGSDAELKKQFDEAVKADSAMAASPRAQLDWVFRHSEHYERTHMLYPVGRLIKKTRLPLKK